MRNLIIRICCLLLIVSSIGIVTPQKTHAASDLALNSICSIGNQQFVWNGTSVVHDNGLIYVARTVAPVAFITKQAYIAIYAVDPNTAINGGCKIVATYLDTTDNFTSLTALYDITVIAKDGQGNLYAGKSTNNSYRVLFIPSSAPANNPFEGLVAHNINSGSGKKEFYNFSSLGVTDNYAMISMNAWNGWENLTADYTIVPTAALKDDSTSVINNSTWKSLGTVGLGLIDTIVGMPDERFFVSAFFLNYSLGAAFVNPVTGAVTSAFNQAKNGMGDGIDCKAPNLHFRTIKYCAFPSSTIGLDGNLYFTAYADGGDAKAIVAWKYNPITNKWSGLGDSLEPTEISAFNDMEPGFGGAKINADADGNVVAVLNGMKTANTVLTFLNKKTDVWTTAIPNPKYGSWGKPDLNFIQTLDLPRISTMFNVGGVMYWATYSGPINISSVKCNPNIVIEGGSYYVNKLSVSGTIYSASTCKASGYYAVRSANATPVDPSDSNLIKPFSPDNGNFSVNGLVPGLNYIHVRLYDKTAAIEKWVTNSVYVDTNPTVQANVTLDNGFNTPSFKDTWSMRASSYTASGYTRSSIGTIRITGVTDPSGLASYAINNQPAVNFDANNINKPIPVNFDSITDTVGISLTLTDGAGNTEVRGLRPLIYDITPPDASSAPTAVFTTTATSQFSGNLVLSSGAITDDIYAASGRQYWGVWVANAKCVGDTTSGCPTDTASQLRWGAVPVTDPTSIQWNLLNGLNQVPSSGLYRTYIRFLDGAGNASTAAAVTVDTTVDLTTKTNKVFMPLTFSQR